MTASDFFERSAAVDRGETDSIRPVNTPAEPPHRKLAPLVRYLAQLFARELLAAGPAAASGSAALECVA